jgi:hypothetical protein
MKALDQFPERFRLSAEDCRKLRIPEVLASTAEVDGRNGMFYVRHFKDVLRCLVGDGKGWEHVSVSLPNRVPDWEEMSYIKDLFWDETECVMQLHPPKKDYVNYHPYCLHLWRPISAEIPRPPSSMVGPK